ncbi:hypothetical protein CB1_000661011 [Camelus ferus]|nr:hypothetical protein CB1_000661011 [Camelus ferus]
MGQGTALEPHLRHPSSHVKEEMIDQPRSGPHSIGVSSFLFYSISRGWGSMAGDPTPPGLTGPQGLCPECKRARHAGASQERSKGKEAGVLSVVLLPRRNPISHAHWQRHRGGRKTSALDYVQELAELCACTAKARASAPPPLSCTCADWMPLVTRNYQRSTSDP